MTARQTASHAKSVVRNLLGAEHDREVGLTERDDLLGLGDGEVLHRPVRDLEARVAGVVESAKGKAQEAYGTAREKAADGYERARAKARRV